jgi:hypothetical protein
MESVMWIMMFNSRKVSFSKCGFRTNSRFLNDWSGGQPFIIIGIIQGGIFSWISSADWGTNGFLFKV